MTRSTLITTGTVAALLAAFAVDASAAPSARVSCEVRSNRSSISIDGRGLAAGSYTTQAVSGANIASSPPEAAVAGEVQTDYDSNPKDIAAGDLPISAKFIVGAKVTGKVLDASGRVVASAAVACRVK